MGKKDFIILVLIFGIIFLTIIFSEIQYNTGHVPETIFIRAIKDNPLLNVSCTADIITKDNFVNDKELNLVDNIFDYFSHDVFYNMPEEGYYRLETGLSKKDKIFEIEIFCIDYNNIGVGYIFMNNTNVPCDLKEGGYVIC